ncbi:MAG: hypothetical protein KR126chlam1_01202 [Chlamydiae bacterium]|nr:hypothetical protein [Chlamydiota bacterium]
MLTSILERGSWFVFKFGMPLVYFYHLIIGSVFFNTAAEDAKGLEKWGNVALAPMQYFFEGKIASPIVDQEGRSTYILKRRFDYDNHFFMKTSASVIALPFSITVGGTLKTLAYLSPSTRERANKIKGAISVVSNLDYYQSIGIDIQDYKKAELIAPPKYKRRKEDGYRFAADIEALKEITHILNKYEIPFWIDCGSCLGAYQYGGTIPHDWDIDIAILRPDFQNVYNALQELDAKKFIVQDWSGRAHPESYLKVYVRESANMIDLYNFAIDEENQTISTLLSNEFNIFMPRDWVASEKRYTSPQSYHRIFPLKKALFEGIEVPVPSDIVTYLQTFYGENLAPAKIYNEETCQYEKDETHPYWQTAHAH